MNECLDAKKEKRWFNSYLSSKDVIFSSFIFRLCVSLWLRAWASSNLIKENNAIKVQPKPYEGDTY